MAYVRRNESNQNGAKREREAMRTSTPPAESAEPAAEPAAESFLEVHNPGCVQRCTFVLVAYLHCGRVVYRICVLVPQCNVPLTHHCNVPLTHHCNVPLTHHCNVSLTHHCNVPLTRQLRPDPRCLRRSNPLAKHPR